VGLCVRGEGRRRGGRSVRIVVCVICVCACFTWTYVITVMIIITISIFSFLLLFIGNVMMNKCSITIMFIFIIWMIPVKRGYNFLMCIFNDRCITILY